MKNKINKDIQQKRWLLFIKVIFLVLLFFFLFSFVYCRAYSQKIYPGVIIGQFDLGGKTKKEAEFFLDTLIEKKAKKGFTFSLLLDKENKEKESFILYPFIISPTDPDLSREIIKFQIKKTVNQAYLIGRRGSIIKRFSQKIPWRKKKIYLQAAINKDEVENILKNYFSSFEEAPKNAYLTFKPNGQIIVEPEKNGFTFDYQKAIRELEDKLKKFDLDSQPIFLERSEKKPLIRAEEIEGFIPQVKKILTSLPFILFYKNRRWIVKKDEFQKWLDFQKKNGKIQISLNQNEVDKFLEKIAVEINQEPQEAKFKMENQKVVEFQPGREGLVLDKKGTCQKIENGIIYNNKKKIEIQTKIIQPKVSLKDINDLGIKELIGQGESNFAGSPKNRIHNIQVGANRLNGLLIPPGEEFSLVKALGKVDADAGYLPELVIKGDRTIPEFGGGLCQIGTTAFRAALNAGLPIVERQPHSYRVSYYEPAGMDATIYDPHPDLRFINDTGNYILWQSKIKGTKLIFEFWGTSDGRKVEVTKPKIFNITSPGPTKYIETDELKPGEKKRIEIAHKGADTEFTRTITYPDGRVKKEVWRSHYKPWPEVYLVGKEKDNSKKE